MGPALAAAHLIVPELQFTNDGINWITVTSTTDYVARLTGHVIGTSSVPTRRTAVFTPNTPQRARGVRVAGRHRQPRLLVNQDLTAARHVGADEGQSRGGPF